MLLSQECLRPHAIRSHKAFFVIPRVPRNDCRRIIDGVEDAVRETRLPIFRSGGKVGWFPKNTIALVYSALLSHFSVAGSLFLFYGLDGNIIVLATLQMHQYKVISSPIKCLILSKSTMLTFCYTRLLLAGSLVSGILCGKYETKLMSNFSWFDS